MTIYNPTPGAMLKLMNVGTPNTSMISIPSLMKTFR